MIKITLPEKVFGMDEFIENFFEDSDSGTCLGRGTINKNGYNLCDSCLCEKDIEGTPCYFARDKIFVIGKNDLTVLKEKIKKDEEISKKFYIQCTITAPLYWWKEFMCYKPISLHDNILDKEFTLDDFSGENLIKRGDELDCFVWYNYESRAKDTMEHIIRALNYYREKYIETNDQKYLRQITQLLPISYNYTKTVILNYNTIYKMYKNEFGNKNEEWEVFRGWAKRLPYFKELYIDKLMVVSEAWVIIKANDKEVARWESKPMSIDIE